MAGTTRLELATSAVTGQRSNQLNYVPTCFERVSGNPTIYRHFRNFNSFRLSKLFRLLSTNFRVNWRPKIVYQMKLKIVLFSSPLLDYWSRQNPGTNRPLFAMLLGSKAFAL